MDEFRVVTQDDLLRNLPKCDESDWVEFALLPVITGKLRVSDPMFFRDLPPSPTFEVECGTYRVMLKTVTYPGDRRVSRLRAFVREPSSFGDHLDDVGVDFAQVGVFDPSILDEAADKMDTVQSEQMVAELDAIADFGIVQLGTDERAIMPVVRSGFGDGRYPIHELVFDGICLKDGKVLAAGYQSFRSAGRCTRSPDVRAGLSGPPQRAAQRR
jgi:hypothetical protein